MLGMQQSRVAAMSTEHMRASGSARDALRCLGMFENSDVFAYERMFTKLVNLNVRCHVLKEIFYLLRNRTLPFELLNEEELMELESKVVVYKERLPL